MPSRRTVALIVLFWLAVTGYVAYRDVWPVLFASGPPPVAIDLADEAAQNVPTRWRITINGKESGRLITHMRYIETDDTFRFTHEYRNVRVEMAGITIVLPEFTTSNRITRNGDLREESADGKIEFYLGQLRLGEATAKMGGTVTDGQLAMTCEASLTLPDRKPIEVKRALNPLQVPTGQPLNPLLPVNRLAGVRPGRRWAVHESDLLKDVLEVALKELGVKLPQDNRGPLIGEVLADSQELLWEKQPTACWVMEYRREGELKARTTVRATDGKVLKQEAFEKGDTITLEREE